MSKPMTRAKSLGIKPEKMAAKAKKIIAKQRAILLDAVAPWCDVDNSVAGVLDETLAGFDNLTTALDESTEWHKEELEADA